MLRCDPALAAGPLISMRLLRRASLLSCLVLFALGALPAEAGVTIRYQGRARSRAAVDKALAAARAEAERLGWTVEDASLPEGAPVRLNKEKARPYKGPIKGIVMRPHPRCEPFYLQFDATLYSQDFVKTQFAGADVHVQIVGLLKKLARHFADLKVEDEGEYWATADRKKLEDHLEAVNRMIRELQATHPNARSPVTNKEGRIVDILR
jgi:hypothetical protein